MSSEKMYSSTLIILKKVTVLQTLPNNQALNERIRLKQCSTIQLIQNKIIII